MLVCLLVLTVTFFLLTIYSILQANAALLPIEASRFFSLKILDTASASSLFVTLIGALLVRHQFALSLLPRINYKSAVATRQDATTIGESHKTWRVEIRNTGLGSATINRAEYLLELSNAKHVFHQLTVDGLINELSKFNLALNRDYWIENITPGFSLSPKDDCFAFEIKMEHMEKLNRLDMVLYFQGQLGDKYSREIFFIPRDLIKLKIKA